MTLSISINSDMAWNAISWFSDRHWHWAEPKFQAEFERMFGCRIVSKSVDSGRRSYFSQVPVSIEFDDEKNYTAFVLRWQ